MTAPDTQQQQPPDHDTRDAVLAALAGWFASAAAIAALRLPARLVNRLVALGYSRKAVLAAARYTMRPPLTGRGRYGSPGRLADSTTARTVAVQEPGLRAQYLINAADRLTEADELDVFEAALRREQAYLQGHVRAGRKRAAAASALDRVAAEHGPYMVWRTQNDARVDPDCRKLAGTIFTVDRLPELDGRPVIPGAAHPFCRCYAEGLYSSSEPMPSIYPTPVDLDAMEV